MVRYIIFLISIFIFGCNLNSEQIVNIEKFTFNDVKFNAVSKNLYFDNLDLDTNTDVNITKKERS